MQGTVKFNYTLAAKIVLSPRCSEDMKIFIALSKQAFEQLEVIEDEKLELQKEILILKAENKFLYENV